MTLKIEMLNRFTVTLALGALLLAGCAQFVWVKSGASQQDFQRDAYECERDMRQSGYFGRGLSAAIESMSFQQRCMVARGWSKQRVDAASNQQRTGDAPTTDAGASNQQRTGSASTEVRTLFQTQLTEVEQKMPKPLRCDPGHLALNGYVADVTNWAEASGLRRGDKVVDGLATSDILLLKVVREGAKQNVSLPCRDHSKVWEAIRAALIAGASGDWTACEVAVNRYRGLRSVPNDVDAELWRYRCAAGWVGDHGGRTDNALANSAYQYNLTLLRVVRYEPRGLDRVRGRILTDASRLRKDGFASLASDLEAELSMAARTVSVPSPSAVQPDRPIVSTGTGASTPSSVSSTSPPIVSRTDFAPTWVLWEKSERHTFNSRPDLWGRNTKVSVHTTREDCARAALARARNGAGGEAKPYVGDKIGAGFSRLKEVEVGGQKIPDCREIYSATCWPVGEAPQ
jgi:hypothetical protein